jgi:hypothetical protein
MLSNTSDLANRSRYWSSSPLASPKGDNLQSYSDALQGKSNGASDYTSAQRAETALKESLMRAEMKRQAAADLRLRDAAHYASLPSSNSTTHLPSSSYSHNSTSMPLINSSAPPAASPKVTGA